jgi:O-acetylhomoserine (thiol)-lyase
MTKPKTTHFDTLSLHAGARPDPTTGARATPIYQTASYVFPDSDHAAALFNMERAGHVYSRISNPTVAVLEERIAALEGGVGAVATASGQAALHLIIATLMGAGGHIVASSRIYGGSHNRSTAAAFGIDTVRRSAEHRCARRSAGHAGSSPGRRRNPSLDVLDIPRVADRARHGPLLSTRRSRRRSCSRAHGADLVFTYTESSRRRRIGGLLVDSGSFDWEEVPYAAARGKFPTLTEPYAGFHDMVFAEESTTAAFLLRARREGIRDFGACMAPFTAFQILQGIETLPLRMARHVENARHVVAFLAAHPLVATVGYPELASHPDHALAQRLLPRGCGAVFSFTCAARARRAASSSRR